MATVIERSAVVGASQPDNYMRGKTVVRIHPDRPFMLVSSSVVERPPRSECKPVVDYPLREREDVGSNPTTLTNADDDGTVPKGGCKPLVI